MRFSTAAIYLTLFLLTITCRAEDKSGAAFIVHKHRTSNQMLRIEAPPGWTVDTFNQTVVSLRKGTTWISLFDIDENAGKLQPKDYLPKVIDTLKDSRTFADLRLTEKPAKLDSAVFPSAYAKVAYKLMGKTDYISRIYIISDSKGEARFGLVSYTPASEKDDCRLILDRIAVTVQISPSPARQADTERGRYTSVSQHSTSEQSHTPKPRSEGPPS